MLELAGIQVDAISVGGLRTCIQLPKMGLAFDMGCCPPSSVSRRTVLFTHAHTDHMASVVLHCATRDLTGMKPPHYVIPPENAEAFEELFAVWRKLDRSSLPCNIHPLGPGKEYALSKGRIARPVRAYHRVAAQGYVIAERKQKLKAEWIGKNHTEIRAARMAGVEITNTVESIAAAFTGDSRIEILDKNPEMYRARLLMMEVTFIDDKVPVERARSQGHIHLDEVIARADRFENEAILFTHLSARYDARRAEEVLKARLPAHLLERVTLLHPPA
ncbi:MAG: ribonuclease Z [Myxococcota bacterium]|jgi:ribonuclease Z